MTWRCVRASRYASETLHTPTRTSLCHPPRSPGLPRPHRRRSHRRRAGQARHDSDARPGLRVTPPRERGPRRGNGGRAGRYAPGGRALHPLRAGSPDPLPGMFALALNASTRSSNRSALSTNPDGRNWAGPASSYRAAPVAPSSYQAMGTMASAGSPSQTLSGRAGSPAHSSEPTPTSGRLAIAHSIAALATRSTRLPP